MPWMRQCGIKNHFRIGDVAAATAGLDDAGVCLSWVYQPVTSTACTIAVWNRIRWMCLPSCLNFTHSLARPLSHCWHIPGVCYMGDSCKLFASCCACYCNPEYCGNSSGEVRVMKVSGEDLSIIHSRVCNAVVHRIVHAFYSYMRKTTLMQKFWESVRVRWFKW